MKLLLAEAVPLFAFHPREHYELSKPAIINPIAFVESTPYSIFKAKF